MAHSIVPHSIVHLPRTVRTRLLRPDGNLLRAVSMLAGGVLGLTTLLAASSTPIVTLTRGPYLQRLTTSGVTIVWNTDVPTACSLAIRPIGGPAAVIPGDRHRLRDPGDRPRYGRAVRLRPARRRRPARLRLGLPDR